MLYQSCLLHSQHSTLKSKTSHSGFLTLSRQYTLYTQHSTPNTQDFAQHTPHFTLKSKTSYLGFLTQHRQYTLYTQQPRRTPHRQYILYTPQPRRTPHITLHSSHSTLHIQDFLLHTDNTHSTLYTKHPRHNALHTSP
ncbi:hypothetical protein ElyMa_005397400 [Elysia marginata]|uniref:Uncharacterized protein n=1 Tax=Elysia marginata TaxID=1093978 RepID=A0AAV4EGQ6_9GAST|nr:hypothetical protein ElyMa_005397400 [Elysia marginata]